MTETDKERELARQKFLDEMNFAAEQNRLLNMQKSR